MGFARVAVKHGCTIIPVINVGTEDMVEVRGEDVNRLFRGLIGYLAAWDPLWRR